LDQNQKQTNQIKGYRVVGKIRDAHGLKGELFVVLFAQKADWVDELEKLVIITKTHDGASSSSASQDTEQETEYNVTRAKSHKIGIIVKVDGVDHRTPAEKLRGALVAIPEGLLISMPGENIYLSELEGFEAYALSGSEESKFIGKIISFSSNTVQDLAVVQSREADLRYEIPLIEEFIKHIDWKQKKIYFDLPEGLLSAELFAPGKSRLS